MAKGTRSNSAKKLRTERRAQLEEQVSWLKKADEKRQAALAAAMASEPLAVVPTCPVEEPKPKDDDGMEVAVAPAKAGKKGKKLRVAVGGKGKRVKKIGVLSGKNQFHKKAKKGQKGRL